LLFDPLVYIAESCGKSLNAFLEKVPTVWQPVMIVIITVFLLLCILLLTKSRIRFGFFEIGPAATQVRRMEREEINALTDRIRQEIRGVIREELVPVRDGNLEELPNLGSAVREERAHDRQTPGGVHDIRNTQSPAT
jgi:hypothetical protein